jgi:DNA (cytosine-5)-methyltransferase 1
MLRLGSLCTGYGGLDLAAETVLGPLHHTWHAENEPGPAAVLAHHWPTTPNLGDLTTVDWTTVPPIDVLTAGFPCQDVSCAGKRAGLVADRVIPAGVMNCGCPWGDHQMTTCEDDDVDNPYGGSPLARFEYDGPSYAQPAVDWLNDRDRENGGPPPERVVKGTRSGVWSYVADAIKELRPKIVLLENVRGLLSARADSDVEPCPWCLGDTSDEPVLRALGAVLADLADLGFDAEWTTVAASDVGAPHRRERVFITAWPVSYTDEGGRGAPFGDVLPREPHVGRGGAAADGVTLLPTPAAARSGRQRSASAGAAIRPSLDSITALLPTPRTSNGKSTRAMTASMANGRRSGGGQSSPPGLDEIAQIWAGHWPDHMPSPDQLPASTSRLLLPTPRATDGTKGGPNQRGSSGDLMLPSAVVQLLPTPTAKCAEDSQTHRSGARADELPLTGVAKAHAAGSLLQTPTVEDASRNGSPEWAARWATGEVIPETQQRLRTQVLMEGTDRWGNYGPAIARWESIAGRAAPDPTEPGTKGQPRLAPRFVEWLMGLPAGWVTDHLPRNAALKCLGNGVVPQQAAHAYAGLLGRVEVSR